MLKDNRIYPERQPNGQILKHIEFNFPVFYQGVETSGISWDLNGTVENVILLSKLSSVKHIDVHLDMTELDVTNAEKSDVEATYEQIKQYVKEHHNLNVSSLYIAQVKRKIGIIERECYNKPKTEDAKQPQCPIEKEKAIREAFKAFGII